MPASENSDPTNLRPLPLTRPFLAAPKQNGARSPAPSAIPAFPEVSSGWEGFCIPHARLLGVHRKYLLGMSKDERQLGFEARKGLAERQCEFERIVLHEGGHWLLSATPMGRLVADKAREVGQSVVSTLTQTRAAHGTKVAVPLVPDSTGSDLQALCAELDDLNSRVMLVQEVFAVWHSLDRIQELGRLSAAERRVLEPSFPARYEPLIKGFSDCYLAFSSLAEHFGLAARFVAVWALHTADPNEAFKAMLRRATAVIADANRDLSRSDSTTMTPILAAAVPYLHRDDGVELLPAFDDDALRTSLNNVVHERSEHKPLVCFYAADDLRLPFDELADLYDDPDGEAMRDWLSTIFNESLRQQLTSGKGLRCPFWVDPTLGCCRFSRPALEAVWQQTVPRDPERRCWQRQGCLTDNEVRVSFR